jgi:cyclophilin family peptidyl-prolyl cis-trans isomerase
MAPAPTVAPAEPVTGETPCPDENSPRTIEFEQAPPMCIDPAKRYTAQISFRLNDEQSNLEVELDAAAAPETVNNFVVLARYHYFDGTVCHRAVPNFVVQCGDPTATGGGGPGYEFGDELPASLDAYVKGAVAMANSGPATNGSQFFFITSDTAGPAFGSPNYSVFGQVTEGIDSTLAGMAGFATDTEVPSGLIQIESVTITET